MNLRILLSSRKSGFVTDPVLKLLSRIVQIIKRLTTCNFEVT